MLCDSVSTVRRVGERRRHCQHGTAARQRRETNLGLSVRHQYDIERVDRQPGDGRRQLVYDVVHAVGTLRLVEHLHLDRVAGPLPAGRRQLSHADTPVPTTPQPPTHGAQ